MVSGSHVSLLGRFRRPKDFTIRFQQIGKTYSLPDFLQETKDTHEYVLVTKRICP